MVFPKNGDYGQNGQKRPFVRKNSDVSDLLIYRLVERLVFTPCLIRFRLTTPLSQAPLLWQDELTRRKRDLDTRGLSARFHTLP